jgi:hypothetical protein
MNDRNFNGKPVHVVAVINKEYFRRRIEQVLIDRFFKDEYLNDLLDEIMRCFDRTED